MSNGAIRRNGGKDRKIMNDDEDEDGKILFDAVSDGICVVIAICAFFWVIFHVLSPTVLLLIIACSAIGWKVYRKITTGEWKFGP